MNSIGGIPIASGFNGLKPAIKVVEVRDWEDFHPNPDASSFLDGSFFLLSPRALEVLHGFIQPNCEELCGTMPEGYEHYRLFNVITLLDAIDLESSTVKYFNSGQVMDIKEYTFFKEIISEQHLFRDSKFRRTFVTDNFYKAVKKENLTCFDFVQVWDSEASQPFKPIYECWA